MKIGLAASTAALALALTSLPSAAYGQGGSQAGARPAAPAAAPAAPPATTTVATSDYVEQNVGGNQVVTFPGDELPGDPNSAYGFTVRPSPRVLRAGLLRPRVNFVSELLKSVENL